MKDLYIGVILAFFSAFTYALGSILVQLLEQAIPDFQLNLYRCIGQTILSGSLLAAQGQNPFVKGKTQVIITTIVGVSMAIQNTLIFVSVLLIPVGSTGSLFHAGCVIFTLLGVWVFRLEPLSCRKMIVFSLTVTGIILTLFSILYDGSSHFEKSMDRHMLMDYPRNESKAGTISDNNITVGYDTQNHSFQSGSQFGINNAHDAWLKQCFGVILSLCSGVANGIFVIGEKKILYCNPSVPGIVLCFWASVAGIPLSLALIPILEQVTFSSDIATISLVIAHALAAGITIILFCLALERASGVVVSLTFTADLPIRTVAQYLVIPSFQPPGGGLFDIIGSVVVTIALCLPGIWDLSDKKKEKSINEERMPLQTEIKTEK